MMERRSVAASAGRGRDQTRGRAGRASDGRVPLEAWWCSASEPVVAGECAAAIACVRWCMSGRRLRKARFQVVSEARNMH